MKTSGRPTTGYIKNNCNIGPKRTSSDRLACEESEIADEFRNVFQGKHLSTQKFDEDHHEYVKRKYSVISIYNEHKDDLFEDKITISELEHAIKELPPTRSFDIDNLHIWHWNIWVPSQASCPSSIPRMPGRDIWPWNISKVVFIRKPNKNSYSDCSSFRPLTISSHMEKLMERILTKHLTLHC